MTQHEHTLFTDLISFSDKVLGTDMLHDTWIEKYTQTDMSDNKPAMFSRGSLKILVFQYPVQHIAIIGPEDYCMFCYVSKPGLLPGHYELVSGDKVWSLNDYRETLTEGKQHHPFPKCVEQFLVDYRTWCLEQTKNEPPNIIDLVLVEKFCNIVLGWIRELQNSEGNVVSFRINSVFKSAMFRNGYGGVVDFQYSDKYFTHAVTMADVYSTKNLSELVFEHWFRDEVLGSDLVLKIVDLRFLHPIQISIKDGKISKIDNDLISNSYLVAVWMEIMKIIVDNPEFDLPKGKDDAWYWANLRLRGKWTPYECKN